VRPRASDMYGMKNTRALDSQSKMTHLAYLNIDALIIGLFKGDLLPGRLPAYISKELRQCLIDIRHEVARICTESIRFGAHRYEEYSESKANLNANRPLPSVLGPVCSYPKRFKKGSRLGPGIGKANALARIQSNRPGNALYLQSLTAEATRMARLSSTLICRAYVPKKPKSIGMGGSGVRLLTMYHYDLTTKHASE